MDWLRAWVRDHPRLASWLVLSLGMIALFLIAARGKGLTAGQLINLCLICVGVAGLCAWIIGWEAE
jgi:thiamine transporter ThiT